MTGNYIYLASPYTHSDAEVRENRYQQALIATGILLKQKKWTYSPIVHCHDLAKVAKLPYDFDFWREYNETMIRGASELLVLQILGWDLSKGVNGEIAFARSLQLPINGCLIDPLKHELNYCRIG